MMTPENYRELMAGGFCAYPFHNIRNSPVAGYVPCCWSKKIDKEDSYKRDPINTTPIKEWFSGDFQTHIRKAMLAGDRNDSLIKSMCSRCKEREDRTGNSPRLMKTTKERAELIKEIFDDNGNIKNRNLRFLSLQLNIWGVPCNLECIGCNPADSTTRYKRLKEIGDPSIVKELGRELSIVENLIHSVDVKKRDRTQFYKIISEVIDNIEIVSHISFCGGEPSLMTNHFELLDAIIASGHAKYIALDYVSNMTLFTLKKMRKYITAFKSFDIQWSVDGMDKVNHYLRYPTDWEATLKNVHSVKKWLNVTKKGRLSVTFTPSNLGILNMKETFDFLEKEGLKTRDATGKFQIYNRLEDPRILRPRNLPDDIKDKIKNDVRSINESVYRDMMKETPVGDWNKCKLYLDKLDASRGTNWRDTFPILAKY